MADDPKEKQKPENDDDIPAALRANYAPKGEKPKSAIDTRAMLEHIAHAVNTGAAGHAAVEKIRAMPPAAVRALADEMIRAGVRPAEGKFPGTIGKYLHEKFPEAKATPSAFPNLPA